MRDAVPRFRVQVRLARAVVAAALVFSFGLHLAACRPCPCEEKRIVGAVETIHVREAGLTFEARVDSGARTCSIHITESSLPQEVGKELIGEEVAFHVENENGESAVITASIEDVVIVRATEGARELRCKVALTLEWRGFAKRVLVTLNDRSKMRHKLLLGRNWLADAFLIDVSK